MANLVFEFKTTQFEKVMGNNQKRGNTGRGFLGLPGTFRLAVLALILDKTLIG